MSLQSVHLPSNGQLLSDVQVTPNDSSLLKSDSIFNIPYLLETYSLLRVEATFDQIVYHPASRPADETYVNQHVIPFLAKGQNPNEYPGLALALSKTFPAPSSVDRSVLYRVDSSERLLLLDGSQRLEAAHRMHQSPDMETPYNGWVFIVLHPRDLPLPIIESIINFSNRHKPSMTPQPVAQLRLALNIAKLAYDTDRAMLITPILKDVLTEQDITGGHKEETTLCDQIRRIVGSTDMVQALVSSNLISTTRPMWFTPGISTISFLYTLERFRLYQNAVCIIYASAILDDRLSSLMGRPFRLSDILTANATEEKLEKGDLPALQTLRNTPGSFRHAKYTEVCEAIADVSKETNLPPLLYCPWVLSAKAKNRFPLTLYLQYYREVLKGCHLIADGYFHLSSMSRRSPGIRHPVDPQTHSWGITRSRLQNAKTPILNVASREQEILDFLTPETVVIMAQSWKRDVVKSSNTLLSGVTVDLSLNISGSREAREIVSQNIYGLLESNNSWYQLSLLMGLQPGDRLGSVGQADRSFVVPLNPTSSSMCNPQMYTLQQTLDTTMAKDDNDFLQLPDTNHFPAEAIPSSPAIIDVPHLQNFGYFYPEAIPAVSHFIDAFLLQPIHIQQALGELDMKEIVERLVEEVSAKPQNENTGESVFENRAYLGEVEGNSTTMQDMGDGIQIYYNV